MKKIFLSLFLISLFASCTNENNPTPQNEVPIIQAMATYNVLVEKDIVYGEGLSHETINSATTTSFPLKLDIYLPDNEVKSRPAFLFIHGGGFTGGSKEQAQIIDWANFYASRGWVFISVDYRLRDDKGTIPQEWLDYSSNLLNEQVSQFLAIYPAQRDAKAALRWLMANADMYNINTDYLTVGGGSAGAITAITAGISDAEDFRDEISLSQDPSLSSTNLDQTYQVKTIVDLWGSAVALESHEAIFGSQQFDANDPPLFIVHGTEDPTVPFSAAEDLKAIYESNGIPLAYYPIQGGGHGVWGARVENKTLEELAFDFIVAQQDLTVE
ncbi:MAG: alpha/beta hydrolase [Bacteroidota bacterium]